MDVDQIRDLYDLLNPDAYHARTAEYVRGGLPGSSFRDGAPSSETPSVELDATDVRMLWFLGEYRDNQARAFVLLAEARTLAGREQDRTLTKVHALLERNRVLETAVVPELHLSPKEMKDRQDRASRAAAELVSPKAAPCANPNCGRVVERNSVDRMVRGRCLPCYEWLGDHEGTERPRELCERDTERRAG